MRNILVVLLVSTRKLILRGEGPAQHINKEPASETQFERHFGPIIAGDCMHPGMRTCDSTSVHECICMYIFCANKYV